VPFSIPAFQSLSAAGDLKRSSEARSIFFERHVPAGAVVRSVEQVHSRTVVDAADPPEGAAARADGMVSAAGGPWLAVTVADCLPLFLFDESTGAYGLLHSGWKGTGILENALSLMAERFGTRSGDVHVLAGAGIHSCCYEVAPERGEVFASWGEHAVVWPDRGLDDGRPHLDLYAANRHLAERLGIATFTQVTNCTCCDERFGSYRREGPSAYTSMIALLGPHN
jgi:hypothetical protein